MIIKIVTTKEKERRNIKKKKQRREEERKIQDDVLFVLSIHNIRKALLLFILNIPVFYYLSIKIEKY